MVSWPSYRIGEILEKSDSYIELDSDTEYQEVTVRLWGKGVELRGTKMGSEIGSGRRIQVKTGQFILSKIDARHGAFGLIPGNLNGAVVTNDFPVFNPNLDLLDPRYLNWLSKTHQFVNACRYASEGTTNRVRLKEHRFLDINISVPTLDVQRRLVKKIESLNKKIEEARVLRLEILSDAQAMLKSVFQKIVEDAPYRTMGEVAPIVRRPVEIEIDVEYPELGLRSFGRGTFHKPSLAGIDVGSKKLYQIMPNDLLFSNVFAWEGTIGVVQSDDIGRVGSHRFISCIAKELVTTPEFLCFYLLSEEGMEKIRDASPGGAGRNRTLGLKKLEKIEVPVPNFERQCWFNSLQKKVKLINGVQSSNQIQLDALMPAILDKAIGSHW